MQKRYFVILLSALLVLSMSIMAGLEDRKEVQQLEDRQEVTAPVSRAACLMTKTNGVGTIIYVAYQAGMRTYTYFDPAVECGPSPYPFELTAFSLTFAEPVGGGFTWPVQFDVVVYNVSPNGDPCQGPREEELCRFPATANQATFGFPIVGTITFPSPCCITGPVYIGIEYTSGVPGNTPSVVYDDNPTPDTCDNWMLFDDGLYYEWYDLWGSPVLGYPLFWVDGETQSVNCGQSTCDWTIDDPYKMHFPQLPNEAGWAVNATAPLVLADDWMCSETGWIKDMHWWGGWKNGLEGPIQSFLISVHSDIPASQNPDGYSKPGGILWEYQIPFDVLEVTGIDPPTLEGWYDPERGEILYDDHQPYYQYNYCLPEPLWFWQDEGVIYWVNISAVIDPTVPAVWGWKSTLDHWNDDAVWGHLGADDWIDLYEPGSGSLPGRQNDFYAFMDPTGQLVDGGGTDFYGDGWYFYPQDGWWNIWFYDHPFAQTRYKQMHLEFDAHVLTPGIPAFIEVAINWSTEAWSLEQPPSDSAPPLPGADEALYIGRKIFLSSTDFDGQHFIFDFPFQDYNPEWVSIDIRGYNFAIPGGFLYHECLPGSDPISMDMAFVVTGEPAAVDGACCLEDGSCIQAPQVDCEALGGTWMGAGTQCGTPEACCLADGSCIMADPLCCQLLGGSAQGPGTTCTAPEACCLPDGSCIMADPLCCEILGGSAQGPGTTCTAPEACCLPDGSCIMADPLCCEILGGSAQGPGTDCTTPEACCLPDGSCLMLDPLCCKDLGGIPLGPGTACTAPEACCLPDGTCIEADPHCCKLMGGTPKGANTGCVSVGCSDTGACCLPDGTCTDGLTALECTNAANNGTYMGDGTTCATVECGEKTGACCLPDGTCTDGLTALECTNAANNGTYMGDGTTCATVVCGEKTGACCWGDNQCVDGITAAECDAAWAGTYMGDGTVCLGDNNGNGEDDLCEDTWQPGDDHKMHYPQLPDEAGWDVNASWPIVLADDWQCGETGWVKDIHFWGSWLDGDESYGGLISFTLSIHSDIPAGTGGVAYSRPGHLLWENHIKDFKATKIFPLTLEGYYDPFGEIVLPDNHQEYYQYDVKLPKSLWFWQDEGTIYWLNITAHVKNPTSPGRWGWKSSIEHFKDDAVWGFDESDPVIVVDNGTGTADLPADAPYSTPSGKPVVLTDGLPDGSPIHVSFSVDSFFDITYTDASDGGKDIIAKATLKCDFQGIGVFSSFSRSLSTEVDLRLHTGPVLPSPGHQQQTIETEILSMSLTSGIFGDPDFCVLRIEAGSDFGLPSPGHVTLTRLGSPGSDWSVDSFFDVTYRIDYVGCPGSMLEGIEGSTVAPGKLQQGNSFVTDWTELYEPPNFDQSMDMSFVITGGPDCDCNPGEANGDGGVNVGDAVYLINYVFKGGPAPTPLPVCSGDANCDCGTNVGDAVYVINYVFKGGPAPCDCETRASQCGSSITK